MYFAHPLYIPITALASSITPILSGFQPNLYLIGARLLNTLAISICAWYLYYEWPLHYKLTKLRHFGYSAGIITNIAIWIFM